MDERHVKGLHWRCCTRIISYDKSLWVQTPKNKDKTWRNIIGYQGWWWSWLSCNNVSYSSSIDADIFEIVNRLFKERGNNRDMKKRTSLTDIKGRIKELISLGLTFIQIILLTWLPDCIHEESLLLSAVHDRMFITKALNLNDIEVHPSDLISDKSLCASKTVKEFGITFTVGFCVTIFVRQVVLGFSWWNVIWTFVMLSTTGIRFFLTAQIIVIACNVSGSTPVVIVVVLMESETKQCK